MKKNLRPFFVEGDTELEFYRSIIGKWFHGLPKTIFNLHGLYNIHRKVYGQTLDYLQKHQDIFLRIFCCIDRESRFQAPPLNINEMRSRFQNPEFGNRVLSVDTIIATTMIESWFFYDIEGIYKFLRVPRARRNPKKYKPPEKFTHIDLSTLFKQNGKSYIKGERCAGFINALDLKKIYLNCQELKSGLDKINRRFNL